MSEEEIEKQYHKMVEAKLIKGVDSNSIENGWDWDPAMGKLKDNYFNDIDLQPYYKRLRRSVLGLVRGPMKTLVDVAGHERKGSFTFIGRLPQDSEERDVGRSPPPGELKAKCCGSVVLCSIDDFREFCE